MRIQSDEPIPDCVEAQLKSGSAGTLMGLRGAVLGGEALDVKKSASIGQIHIVPPRGGSEKPAGEWNRYKITIQGGNVRAFLNGELANEATGAEVVPGAIGFQSEGGVIEFRRMELTVLD